MDANATKEEVIGTKCTALLSNLNKQHLYIPKTLSILAKTSTINDSSTSEKAIGDSGCSDTIIRHCDAHLLQDVQRDSTLEVELPDGSTIRSTARGVLKLNNIPAMDAYIFDDAHLQRSLLSLSALTNLGCTATLTADGINVSNEYGKIVLHSKKNRHEKLWTVDLTCALDRTDPDTAQTHVATAFAGLRLETNATYVNFAHQSFGSPPISTFINAVSSGYLSNYPRLTAQLIRANPPSSMATAKGYLDQVRQGLQSTKAKETYTRRTEDSPVTVLTVPISLESHSDLSGRFPVPSVTGEQYVLLSVWNGYVHMEPMANRKSASYARAFEATYAFFHSAHGSTPTLQRLDNETSGELEATLRKLHTTVTYVPPGSHRRNKAERALRHAKNHIVATLCGAHKDCPSALWSKALPQAELTLNHLRRWATDASKSAWHGLHGNTYDWRAHPIAPFGTRVLIHDKPDKRASWAPHGSEGFYLGPARDHYRCWRVWASSAGAERISDTLAWFPNTGHMPGHSTQENVIASMQELIKLLRQDKTPSNDTNTQRLTQELRTLAETYSPTLEQGVPSTAPARSTGADARDPTPPPHAPQEMQEPEPDEWAREHADRHEQAPEGDDAEDPELTHAHTPVMPETASSPPAPDEPDYLTRTRSGHIRLPMQYYDNNKPARKRRSAMGAMEAKRQRAHAASLSRIATTQQAPPRPQARPCVDEWGREITTARIIGLIEDGLPLTLLMILN